MSSERLARAVQKMVDDAVHNALLNLATGTVTDTDPLVIEVLKTREVLHDDQFVLVQSMELYDRLTGIDVGDTVLLRREHAGDGIAWYVENVVADTEPLGGGASQEDVDAAQAAADAAQAAADAAQTDLDAHEAAVTGMHGVPAVVAAGQGLLRTATGWQAADLATVAAMNAADAATLAQAIVLAPATAGRNTIQPAAGVVGLQIKGATANALEVRTAANALVGSFDGAGQALAAKLGVGVSGFQTYWTMQVAPQVGDFVGTEYYTSQTYPAFHPVNDTNKNFYGQLAEANIYDDVALANLTAAYYGGRFRLLSRLTSRVMSVAYGGFFQVYQLGNGGTISNAYAGYFSNRPDTGGTITNSYHVFIDAAAGVGTVVNQFGLYVASQTRGTTTNYAIYTAGGQVRHIAGAAGTSPLVLVLAAAPTADAFQILASNGATKLMHVSAAGGIFSNGTAVVLTNDARLSDQRVPVDLSVTLPKLAAALVPVASGGTAGAGALALRALGATAETAAAGNDARLSDARVPTGAAGGDLGGTFPNPLLVPRANTWLYSADGVNRLHFVTNGRTYVAGSNGVAIRRNSDNSDIALFGDDKSVQLYGLLNLFGASGTGRMLTDGQLHIGQAYDANNAPSLGWVRDYIGVNIRYDGTYWQNEASAGNNGWTLIAFGGAPGFVKVYAGTATGNVNRQLTPADVAGNLVAAFNGDDKTTVLGGVLKSMQSVVSRLGEGYSKAVQQEFFQLWNGTDGQDWSVYRPSGTRQLAFFSSALGNHALVLDGGIVTVPNELDANVLRTTGLIREPGGWGADRYRRWWKASNAADGVARQRSIALVTRSRADWSVSEGFMVTVRTSYYDGGGYVRALVTAGWADTATFTSSDNAWYAKVLECSGPNAVVPRIGPEFIPPAGGNLRSARIYIDLPAYMAAQVEVEYLGEVQEVAWPHGTSGSIQVTFEGLADITGDAHCNAANYANLAPHDGAMIQLPGQAYDGQEIAFLADNATGVVWNLRYRAANSSPYKWEVVGGSPLLASIDTLDNMAIPMAAYGDLATVGPSLTLPLAGDYDLEYGQRPNWTQGTVTGPFSVACSMNVSIAGAAPVTADEVTTTLINDNAGRFNAGHDSRPRRKTGLAAGTVVKAQYKHDAGSGNGNPNVRYRWLKAMPVRVG